MAPLLVLALAGALLQAAPSGSLPGSLSGRVIEDGTNAPVPGARVLLAPDRRGPFLAGDRPLDALTGADGRFTIERVPPGQYRVNLEKAGFATLPRARPLPLVEIQAGQRAAVPDLVLARGGAIAGRVIDENGEPVANALVRPMRRPPRPAEPGSLMPAGGGAQTDDLGEFRVHSLAPGEYYVQVAPAPGRALAGSPRTTMIPTFFPGTANPAAAQPIAVAAGQTAGDVVIRILTGAAFRIDGIALDEHGAAVSGAMVVARPGPSRGGGPFGGLGMNRVRTGPDGRFAIEGLVDGEYVLSAAAPQLISSGGRGNGGTASGVGSASIGGIVGGAGWSIFTETRNGTTLQYQTDPATQQPIIVNGANVTGVQLVAHRPAQ